MLVDAAMLGAPVDLLRSGDSWHDWLLPIYEGKAADVGPIVIDVEAAYKRGKIDAVMTLANELRPALHASFLETALPLAELTQHLKHFVLILHEDGRQQSLRFADCAVLSGLAHVLSPAQWATMCSPLFRWLVHARAGDLVELPPAQTNERFEETPLRLTQQQVAALLEAAEPDRMVAAVREREPAQLTGNAAEQYQWAKAAHELWRTAENTSLPALYALTAAAIATRGELLSQARLPELLKLDLIELRGELGYLVSELTERRRWREAGMQVTHATNLTKDFRQSMEGGQP